METKDLLKGLGGKVTIENLSTYLQQTGVIVEPHVGRLRKKFSIPKKILGIKNDDEFYKEYVSGSSFSLLSKNDENALASLESSVRAAVKKYAIGYNGKYMPIDTYKNEYLPYFNEKKEKYFERRDQISESWDEIIAVFKKKLETFLESRNLTDDEIEELKNEIYSQIPKKQSFIDSFYMNVSLSAFPVPASLSILDESISDEIKDSIARDSLKSLYEILGSLMQDSFKSINTILAYYNENGVLSRKYKSVLNELSKRLVKNNILKNHLIDTIVSDIKNLDKLAEDDDIIESCEVILAKIYGFACEVNVEEYLDFSESELNQAILHTIYLSLTEE